MNITSELLYGAAYYDEYLPVDRLDEDMRLMREAGMNLVRIAESTWATEEPRDGVFDFTHVRRVLDAAERHGIKVIIGTPTYAFPAWLSREHPDVIAETHAGQGHYGARQIMDITNEHFLFHAERVIRKLLELCCERSCVIGFQIDNETKYYDALGPAIQRAFIDQLKERFHNSTDELNSAFGLDYWSNRIDAWEDFPDVRGTINASVAVAFDRFRRELVRDYLAWQAAIVGEYARHDQFVTHNFDYEWRGYSFGVQPAVDHFRCARCLDIAGVDIYHPAQSQLTGAEISFGGDIARALKGGQNYLVLETQAQGNPGWTPYPGQLRLQAYAHLASGAACVEYWHWHSIHNSFETFWKGVLSHDLEPNACYRECQRIGREWQRLAEHLVGLKKRNRVVFLVSNPSLTGIVNFPVDTHGFGAGTVFYNDVFRALYDEFYRQNCEVDMMSSDCSDFSAYDLVVVPCGFCMSESQLHAINEYVRDGGAVLATFKTGFSNEDAKVYHDVQPHIIHEALGVTYQEFSYVEEGKEHACRWFMELLQPQGARALMSYDNPAWAGYAAVTEHDFGDGKGFYFGTMPTGAKLTELVAHVLDEVGYSQKSNRFPLIVKRGVNRLGKDIVYYLNFSDTQALATCSQAGVELVSGKRRQMREKIQIPPWGLEIIES